MQSRFTRITKAIHLGLAVSVTVQLFVAQVMSPPKPLRTRDVWETFGYEIHEWVGLLAIAFTLAHLLNSITTHDDARINVLFPWRRVQRALWTSELRDLLKGILPASNHAGGVASLVQGLGFLAVCAMGISGLILFLGWPEVGAIPSEIKFVGELHEIIANIIWLYWGAHVGMGVLHHIKGENTLTSMMRFWSR